MCRRLFLLAESRAINGCGVERHSIALCMRAVRVVCDFWCDISLRALDDIPKSYPNWKSLPYLTLGWVASQVLINTILIIFKAIAILIDLIKMCHWHLKKHFYHIKCYRRISQELSQYDNYFNCSVVHTSKKFHQWLHIICIFFVMQPRSKTLWLRRSYTGIGDMELWVWVTGWVWWFGNEHDQTHQSFSLKWTVAQNYYFHFEKKN